MKIIISEGQFNNLKKRLFETIEPKEAYTFDTSLQTVVNGRRGVGFSGGLNYSELNKLKNSKLKFIHIKDNNAYVYYRDGFEEQAQNLANIARLNNGFLPVKKPEETYTIGILLGYNKESVIEFVKKHFPDFVFY
jgi:hypothetical protein